MLFFSKRRGAGRRPGGFAARSSSLVVRYRRWVLAAWLAVLAGGVAMALSAPARLATSYSVPGTDSARADAVLARGFGARPEGTFTVVFRVRHSSDRGVQARLRRQLEAAARVLPGGRLDTFRAGAGVVYGELASRLDLQQAAAYTTPLRRALGPAALVTGVPAVQHDLDPQLASDLRRGEALALPLAVVVLAFVLGISVALAVPFAFAAFTIAGTLLLVEGAARLVPVTSYATNLVGLIGLGLAVDYSLLVVCRYREELERGADRETALARTMTGAGRAVVFSGVAVAIGLALLLCVPVPFVRTLGLAGLLIPLVAIAAALTLLPVLLSCCGPRAFARRRPRGREPWAALARVVMRRPVLVFAATTALLLAAAAPALSLRLTPGSLASLPGSTEATRGLVVLRDAFGPGAVTPTAVAVDAGQRGAARRPAVHAAVERLANGLFHDPEVYVVATGRRAPYVSSDGRYARVLVIGRHEYGEPASQRLVARIRDTLVPAARFPAGTRVLAGGAAPQGVDFLARTYAYLPWLVALALVLTFGVLVRAFRSLLLPLKAVVLNLLSVAAACGLLVAVFGSQVEGWVPVFLLAALFGLSLDYEVFLVSRMREEWVSRGDNEAAVAVGLERTGRLITAAALVMAISFGGFVVGGVPGLREFGLGLALAVLIDATLVRALLVPSFMAIAGRWNWWLPSWRRTARRLAVALAILAAFLAAPGGGAVASVTVRLVIAHVVSNCHVWTTAKPLGAVKTLGPAAKLTVHRGTRVVIRSDCPMDFDFAQTKGPPLRLGNPRTYAGSTRTIVFAKTGAYKLTATNVETPEERGLTVLGTPNTLTLTVVVTK